MTQNQIVNSLSIEHQPLSAGQLTLLNRCFPVPEGESFLNDFPIWNTSNVSHYSFRDNDTVVATASMRRCLIKTGREGSLALPLSIAMIGGVATHPEYRGRGLASKLVEQATQDAQAQGAALSVLWGSETEFYRKLGYDWMGLQTRVLLSSLNLATKIEASGVFELPELNEGWNLGLIRSLVARPTGVKLEYQDQDWISLHKNVKWYWIGSPFMPDAYCAVGKGIDLENTVHEWGGKSQSQLNQLLYLVSAKHPEASLLSHPLEFVKRGWAKLGENLPTEPLCMGKVLNEAEVVRRLGSHWHGNPHFWFWGLDGC